MLNHLSSVIGLCLTETGQKAADDFDESHETRAVKEMKTGFTEIARLARSQTARIDAGMKESQNSQVRNGAVRRLLLALVILFACANANSQSIPNLDSESEGLVVLLRKYGFKVLFQDPPTRGAYGLFKSSTKTIIVSPLAYELGIGKQVLLHEAVHAAQSCPTGTLSAIGAQISTSSVVKREISGILYQSYDHGSKSVEQEAFLIQGDPSAVSIIKKALEQRCKRR